MYWKNGKKLGVNTVFIQPTNACNRNCKNCYVKQHRHLGPQLDPREHLRFQRMLWWKESISCNQITISLDSLAKSPEQLFTGQEQAARNNNLLLECARFSLLHVGLSGPELDGISNPPEIHLTLNSIEDFHRYGWHPRHNSGISVITFSSLPGIYSEQWAKIEEIQSSGIKVNWNYMLPCDQAINPSLSDTLRIVLKDFESKLKLVDSAYLVVTKEPVGKYLDLEEWIGYKKRLRSQLEWARIIKASFPDKKIMMDTCVEDCIESRLKGCGGCSANVSKFQVWPDGSVSGCPYALRSTTGPANNAEGIIDNIRAAQRHYDFRDCILSSLME